MTGFPAKDLVNYRQLLLTLVTSIPTHTINPKTVPLCPLDIQPWCLLDLPHLTIDLLIHLSSSVLYAPQATLIIITLGNTLNQSTTTHLPLLCFIPASSHLSHFHISPHLFLLQPTFPQHPSINTLPQSFSYHVYPHTLAIFPPWTTNLPHPRTTSSEISTSLPLSQPPTIKTEQSIKKWLQYLSVTQLWTSQG